MARLSGIIFCAACSAAGEEQTYDLTFFEQLLKNSLSAGYSYAAVFDTHPATEANNTGNVFNFIPNGQLIIRHSTIGLTVALDDPDTEGPGETTALISIKILPAGLFSEAETGEAHHILAKVMDRNFIEPALRKVLRGKLGEAVAHNLDRTVVDRISDGLADEILRRIPVTASVREFMVEIGRVLDEERVLRFRAGVFRPSFGAPRDDMSRTKLAERLISGSDFEYAMAYPGRTLVVEAEYLLHLHLPAEHVLRIIGGIHQAQDPDPTLGTVFRNAVFDEGATELSFAKITSPHLQLVFSTDRYEAYASVADNEGLAATAGFFYKFTDKTSGIVEAAYHDPNTADLTPLEEFAETVYRRGASVTVMHDLTEKLTGYVMADALMGRIGRKRELTWEKVELGTVYQVNRAIKVGFAAYGVDKNDNIDTGFKLSFGATF